MNGTGSLVMRAEKVGTDTLLAQIVRMVVEAQRSRAPIQKLVDVVAAYFVPSVVGIAALTLLVWALVGPEPRMAHAIINAVALLIIACPCALGLATPMSIMAATGMGATMGVLLKNAEAIEVMRRVDTLVVDKTGSLTEGKPKLSKVISMDGVDEQTLLRLAAILEKGSEHPLAAAIVKGALERKIPLQDWVRDQRRPRSTPGGMHGSSAGQQHMMGSCQHMMGPGMMNNRGMMSDMRGDLHKRMKSQRLTPEQHQQMMQMMNRMRQMMQEMQGPQAAQMEPQHTRQLQEMQQQLKSLKDQTQKPKQEQEHKH